MVGTEVVIYDIYGKYVLISNKIESNEIEGEIIESEA